MNKTTSGASGKSAAEKIQLALVDLMKEKPYRNICVSELAKTAGVSRQAFYLNFSDKEEVLKQLLLRLFTDIMSAVEAEKTDSVDNLIRVYTGIVEKYSAYLKILADNDLGAFLSRIFIDELVSRDPVLKIQKQPKDEDERLYINSFWVSAFTNVYTEWLKGGMKTPVRELNGILSDIMTGVYFR